MNYQYFEMTVERKVFQGLAILKRMMFILILITLFIGYAMMRPLLIVTVLLVLVYYYVILRLDSDFEYFYMDGELSIAQIINQSRRKEILNVNESMITVIAPYDAPEIKGYRHLKLIDCSANDSDDPPYVMICQYKNVQTRVYLQLNEGFLSILKQEMPYKVVTGSV